MRRLMLVYLMVIIGVLSTATVAFGVTSASSPNTLLTLYQVEDSFAVGLQQHLLGNFYGMVDIEYWNSLQDLRVHAGALYYMPRDILFFKFYSGVGAQFSRDKSIYKYPYILIGTRFLFFFSEVLYPWAKQTEPEYRVGFSLDFSKVNSKPSSSSAEITEDKSFQRDYDLFPNIKIIKIDNKFGEVEIKSGADGVVSVIANIEIHADQQKKLDLYRDDFKIVANSQDDCFTIKTQLPKSKGNLQIPEVTVKMLVYVPGGITIEVNDKEVQPFETESY